jgi:ribosomal protein S18 acetylase RimI-like enzyme
VAEFHVLIARRGEYLDEAGQIWAEATAARDGVPEIAPITESRPIIEGVVNGRPSGLLLVALDRAGAAVGFAAIELPAGAGGVAEVRYLGVIPGLWGKGAAAALLGAVADELRNRGFREAILFVYEDNPRAVRLYRRLGWRPQLEAHTHPRSGRLERRYAIELLPGR